ncbi:hypothetical protein K470DRAFT_255448 [Piedraia hortae CBS 480.64]|uniref:BZIP domain-containing protein n=1 Tax=Piedraia hortae CBS 480.64 TaxID=1314780 RepID=A0A6A7C787_9PEZI|nr:hypothetical protein K470DRAFT_255448 [Piedraia hortae CBS 480.64]
MTAATRSSPTPPAKSMPSSPRTRSSKKVTDTIKTEDTGDTPTERKEKSPAPPTTNAPLAPPPKPAQTGEGDYKNHLSNEENPFDSAFGVTAAGTPGKGKVPSFSNLPSPAPALPASTPTWAGPLNANIGGPSDYFTNDHHQYSGSFPTQHESSLRSGLTPGGSGFLFTQQSPDSQVLYNQLQSGGATPNTIDFHRTAMTARATNPYGAGPNGAGSQAPSNANIQPDLDTKPMVPGRGQETQDPFSTYQTNDAANGLYMLAQAGGQRGSQSYGVTQPSYPVAPTGQMHARQGNDSIVSALSSSTHNAEFSDHNQDGTGQGRGLRKKTSGRSGKRKAEETSRGANKKSRTTHGRGMASDAEDDGHNDSGDGKKLTEDEKRKSFLERNRLAALKCRQRKKQWLADLQNKVEVFGQENESLNNTVLQLKEELQALKALLVQHKDCPVSQAQGISGMAMQQLVGDTNQYAHPYGMGGPVAQAQVLPQSNQLGRG